MLLFQQPLAVIVHRKAINLTDSGLFGLGTLLMFPVVVFSGVCFVWFYLMVPLQPDKLIFPQLFSAAHKSSVLYFSSFARTFTTSHVFPPTHPALFINGKNE